MRIWSVEETFKIVLRHIPQGVAQLLLSIWAVGSWIAAPVNFLSQIAELRLVVDFWSGLVLRLAELRPALNALMNLVAPIVGAWRQITTPMREWASSLLDVEVPPFAVHFLLMIALSVPALVRLAFAHSDIMVKTNALRTALLDKLNSRSRDEPTQGHGVAIISGLLASAGASRSDLDDLERELKWGNLRRMGVRYDSSLEGASDLTVRDRYLDLRTTLARRTSAISFLIFAAAFTTIGGILVVADLLTA